MAACRQMRHKSRFARGWTAIRTKCVRPQKKRVFKRAPNRPQGLYLWGVWGRGKSMAHGYVRRRICAMCLTRRSALVHAFLQEIHNAMHEARKTGVVLMLFTRGGRQSRQMCKLLWRLTRCRFSDIYRCDDCRDACRALSRCRGCGDDLRTDYRMICTKTG